MPAFRCGSVAFLGRPNVGKSSIVNALVGEKVVAVSSKPQTTRNAIRCILTTDKSQIIFVDTPGVHVPKHALGDFMLAEAREALSQVDVACFVAEATDRFLAARDEPVIELLRSIDVPILLVLNKVDHLGTPDEIWKAVEVYQDSLKPVRVVPLSACKKINVDILLEEIQALLPECPPIYPEDQLMDCTERFWAAEIIREKILQSTDQEVPHSVAVVVEEFLSPDEYPDLKRARIRADVLVERPGQKAILIGKKGQKLKEIGTAARLEMEAKWGYPIYLELWVKVRPGWRSSPGQLRTIGLTH